MNASSSFSSFGAFLYLLLGFLVLTLTLDDALAKDDAKTATDGVKVKPAFDVSVSDVFLLSRDDVA